MNAKYQEYLNSNEWAQIKVDLIQLRGCKCENCGRPRPINKLQIHHKTYERIFNELPSDLIILCAVCHMKEHGLIKEKPKKPVKVKSVKKKKPKRKNIWQVVAEAKQGKYKSNSKR